MTRTPSRALPIPPVAASRSGRRPGGLGWRFGVAALALGAGMLVNGAAMAQQVRVFEEAPPLEVLRSILIPESTGGAARKIVLPHRDALDPQRPVQPAAAQGRPPMPQPQPPQAAPAPAPAEVARTADPPASPPATSAPAATGEALAGVVGMRINFALNSAVLVPESRPFLDRLAELMREEPRLGLVVEGHTDAYGGAPYNLDLSHRRAEAVAIALVQRGIPPQRLEVVGKGKGEPLVSDPYDPRNRRVQFVSAELQAGS